MAHGPFGSLWAPHQDGFKPLLPTPYRCLVVGCKEMNPKRHPPSKESPGINGFERKLLFQTIIFGVHLSNFQGLIKTKIKLIVGVKRKVEGAMSTSFLWCCFDGRNPAPLHVIHTYIYIYIVKRPCDHLNIYISIYMYICIHSVWKKWVIFSISSSAPNFFHQHCLQCIIPKASQRGCREKEA